MSSILWSETCNFYHQCVTVPSIDDFLLSLLISLKSNKTKLDCKKLKKDNEGVCVCVCVCVRVRERGAHTGCVVSLETDNKTVIEDLPSSAWRPTENHFLSLSLSLSLFSSSSSSSLGYLSLSLSYSLSLFLALSRFTFSSPSSPLG